METKNYEAVVVMIQVIKNFSQRVFYGNMGSSRPYSTFYDIVKTLPNANGPHSIETWSRIYKIFGYIQMKCSRTSDQVAEQFQWCKLKASILNDYEQAGEFAANLVRIMLNINGFLDDNVGKMLNQTLTFNYLISCHSDVTYVLSNGQPFHKSFKIPKILIVKSDNLGHLITVNGTSYTALRLALRVITTGILSNPKVGLLADLYDEADIISQSIFKLVGKLVIDDVGMIIEAKEKLINHPYSSIVKSVIMQKFGSGSYPEIMYTKPNPNINAIFWLC